MIEVRGLREDVPDPGPARRHAQGAGDAAPSARPSTGCCGRLRGVSFDVRRGEFFGIVGRNGSGKSTLLKILVEHLSRRRGHDPDGRPAGALHRARRGLQPRADGARERHTQRRDDGPRAPRGARRLDSVLEFAELGEFVDLKLKNYSSGMLVRLAFAVMVEADADIMLIDEVLAVGDAAFAQKCMDVFHQKRDAGKTLVLVTHDMATVQGFCDRAMLLHDGQPQYIGDPEETALRYYRINFGGQRGAMERRRRRPRRERRGSWTRGSRTTPVRASRTSNRASRSGLNLIVEARQELRNPVFNFQFINSDGVWVFGFTKALSSGAPEPACVAAGERIRIGGRIENPLAAWPLLGRLLDRARPRRGECRTAHAALMDLIVYGTRPGAGSVSVRADVGGRPGARSEPLSGYIGAGGRARAAAAPDCARQERHRRVLHRSLPPPARPVAAARHSRGRTLATLRPPSGCRAPTPARDPLSGAAFWGDGAHSAASRTGQHRARPRGQPGRRRPADCPAWVDRGGREHARRSRSPRAPRTRRAA